MTYHAQPINDFLIDLREAAISEDASPLLVDKLDQLQAEFDERGRELEQLRKALEDTTDAFDRFLCVARDNMRETVSACTEIEMADQAVDNARCILDP
jgi:vacuolar-type H+-ATPase subunit D/Vma8